MNAEGIVITALMGGAAGAVGWLATRRWEKTHQGPVAGVRGGLVAAAAVVAVLVVVPQREAAKLDASLHESALSLFGPEAASVYATELGAVVRDKRFAERLKTAGQQHMDLALKTTGGTQTAAANMSAAGMMRLSDQELESVLGVKQAMAEASAALCAGFWKGNVTQALLAEGLKRLPTADQMVWARASVHAMKAEMDESSPPHKVAVAQVADAMQKVATTLSVGEGAAWERAFREGANAAPADACQTFLLAAKKRKDLSAADRAVVVRTLATPDAITP